MNAQDVIIRRVAKEVGEDQRVALGRGLPELLAGMIPAGTEAVRLGGGNSGSGEFDIVVVEPSEVSQSGDLCLETGSDPDVQAQTWIAVTLQTDPQGNPRIVKRCSRPVSRHRCVKKIITEKGVIEVTEKGLVLKEIRPGIATDQVKKETGASLHVADDLKLMEI
jgi:acyl CoA:acetate/3-ketoacid CoA transferase beta subunit